MSQPLGGKLSLPLSVFIVATVYLLVLALVRYEDPFKVASEGYYNLQVDGWLQGRLDVPAKDFDFSVVRTLGAKHCAAYLRDKGVFDLCAYKGKVFSYFGPVPALLVHLPVRLLTGIRLPARAAVLFFAAGAFLWGVALARTLQRRHFPRLPEEMFELFTLTLGLANVGPFLIRRSRVYETAIASGMFFQAGALYFLVTAFEGSQVSRRKLFWASLFLGLSAGSRPHMTVACAALLLIAAAKLVRTRFSGRDLAALFAPFSLVVVLLLAHNQMRFDNPLEFGMTYQLNPASNYGLGMPQGQEVSHLPPVLYGYLFQPPELVDRPPFFKLQYPQWPAYLHPFGPFAWDISGVAGVFSAAPLTMLVFFAPALFFLGRAENARVFFTRRGPAVRAFFLLAVYYFGVPFLIRFLTFFGNAGGPLHALDRWYESLPLPFVALMILYACVLARLRGAGEPAAGFPTYAAALLLTAFAVNLLVLTSAVTAAMRYLGDFTQPLLILSGLLWFESEKRFEGDRLNFWTLRAVAATLAFASVVFGLAYSLAPVL